MKRILLFLFLLVFLAAAGAGGYSFWWVNKPASGSPDEVIVEIPKGAGLSRIAVLLEQNGVLSGSRQFRYYVRALQKQNRLRAGEFRLRKDLTPAQLLDTLLNGEVVLHKVTVPEGLRAKEIATLVQAAGLATEAEFDAVVNDRAFAQELGIPAPTLEGYLFPDTYAFEKNAGAKGVATAMVRRFQAVWTDDLEARAAGFGLTTHQAVTLASIVEKETGDPSERPIIAGVFHNRLKKGMRLESDPTIIYGMVAMGTYDGNIRKKDIRDPANLYSTYVIKGLPPGPIASPGADALRAVAYPSTHDYLFFVAKGAGSGSHHFSSTLEEHERNVTKYQRRPRAKSGADAAAKL